MRTEELLEQSQALTQELQSQSEELKTRAGQLGQQNRDIEVKNREIEIAAAQPRGEGRAARAVLEVQVGVPGQHVARAAHAAQLAADPGQAAGRQRGRAPDRAAGRVRQHDPRRRQRPAVADQRHPRPLQGRGGQDGDPPGAARPGRGAGVRRARRSGRWPRRRGWASTIELERGPAAHDHHRRAAAPAGAQEPALERVQVHRARGRDAADRPGGRRRADRVLGGRHRDRDPAGQAADHLRGLPAGRGRHEPQARRHRPGPVDLARDRPAAGRRARRVEQGRRGQRVHAVPAA